VARWERLVRDIAEEHGVFVTFANLVGSEGGKMFPGASMVMGPRGDGRARAPVWDEAILTATIDLGDLARARADAPLLADLRTALPHLRTLLDGVDRNGVRQPVQWDAAPDTEDTSARTLAAASAASTTSATSPNLADDDLCVVPGGEAARGAPPPLDIQPELVEQWLVAFIRDEMRRRGFERAVIGLSGGVDSAVATYLAARALGPQNVIAVRLPYRTSNPSSLDHAQLVVDALGIESRTVDISAAVDGYLANEPEADPGRRGNVMARMRMIALFDLSSRYRALPLGTGNKTERLFGYFTWHADDSPPINPLGDLFKTQVWALARHLGVPDVIVAKPASADLITGQTDEGDFGITYLEADQILNWLLSGYTPDEIAERGFGEAAVTLVRRRLESTHWKRRLPTVAMLSPTAIGESYLRPVDY
jgi:NAD+ synthetase